MKEASASFQLRSAAVRLDPGLQTSGFVSTPVVAILDQTADIRTFRMVRPTGFDFEAGQFLTVGLEINGRRLTRRYSISSAPESTGFLEISVKRQGLVSGALHSTVRINSLLSVRPPAGEFVYPAGDPRPLVLLAGGLGCTPLISMLRHAAICDSSRTLTCLLSVRTERDVAFRRDLVLLRRQNPEFRIGVTLTREQRAGFLAGRIDQALLRRAVPDPANSLFFICAPVPMIEEMKRLLSDLEVPPDQIRWEVFDNDLGTPHEAPALPAEPEPSPSQTIVDVETFIPVQVDQESDAHRSGEILQFPRPKTARPIQRFRRVEIMLHWGIAIPFLVCFVTGFLLKVFFDLHAGLSRDVLSWLHRIAGTCMAGLPILAVLRHIGERRVLLDNLKQGWIWRRDDLKWLLLMGPAAFSRRITLPDQGKFNAAEKLNFMMVCCAYPLFIATGILLWNPGMKFLSWIVHVGFAVIATPLVLGHIYMALVNPKTRVGLSGMVSGQVDGEWAKHHYRRWYQENFEDDGTPRP